MGPREASDELVGKPEKRNSHTRGSGIILMEKEKKISKHIGKHYISYIFMRQNISVTQKKHFCKPPP
jgi:hypothetical protein